MCSKTKGVVGQRWALGMHSFFATNSMKRSDGRDMKLGEALVSVKLPSFFKTLQREDLGEVVIVTKGSRERFWGRSS